MSLIWPEIEDNDETVYINRYAGEKVQTLGEMVYRGRVVAKTLELPWKDNQRKVSCVPTGRYFVTIRWSKKYGNHYHLTNVKGRDMILMHHGNYYTDILGCILVGYTHTDINKDGYRDVARSKDKMKELLDLLPVSFNLVIS